MNRRPLNSADRPALGSIRADEVLPFREAARRLGWAAKTRRAAKRAGLRTITFGRAEFILGADLVAFFQAQQRDAAEVVQP